MKYNEQEAVKLIQQKQLKSVAAILKAMGMYERGGENYKKIYNTIKKFNLDDSHFLGQASRRGGIFGFKYPISDYFNGKRRINSNPLKFRLFDEQIKERKCEVCSNTSWLGDDIPLELHHKDGNHHNNHLENLQILCPNCHSKTTNFGIRKISKPVDEQVLVEAIKTSYSATDVLRKLGRNLYGKSHNRIKKIKEKYNLEFLKAPTREDKLKYIPNPFWRTAPRLNKRKVIRPSKNELISLIKGKSFSQIAKSFNLTGNAIVRWCEDYQIDYKSLSPFSHFYKKANPKSVKEKVIRASQYAYVQVDKGNSKWRAIVRKNGKALFFKRGETELEAAEAIAKYFNSDKLILRNASMMKQPAMTDLDSVAK